MAITEKDLENWFTYHPPTSEEQKRAYLVVREAGLIMAGTILDYTPVSADQTAAIRAVRQAVMWANAAIACHSAPEVPEVIDPVTPAPSQPAGSS